MQTSNNTLIYSRNVIFILNFFLCYLFGGSPRSAKNNTLELVLVSCWLRWRYCFSFHFTSFSSVLVLARYWYCIGIGIGIGFVHSHIATNASFVWFLGTLMAVLRAVWLCVLIDF